MGDSKQKPFRGEWRGTGGREPGSNGGRRREGRRQHTQEGGSREKLEINFGTLCNEPILEPPSDIDQCHSILVRQAIFRSHFPAKKLL